MPEPTGNVWRDPDTKELANPDNVQLDTYQGERQQRKHGPTLTDPARQGPDPIAAKEAERLGVTPEELVARSEPDDDLPEVPRPVLGPAVGAEKPALEDGPTPPPASDPRGPAFEQYEDYEGLVNTIRDLGPRARQGDAEATADLNRIAAYEYGREDGGRLPIKKRLSALGIGNPNSE